ncbi:MFS transporter [Nocardia sp. NPDC047038]|uniref:MFS transporter n=1 Tax=Nocardia sp. NPDC047038 TaxID=3154338 RepID=UPI0033ED0A41
MKLRHRTVEGTIRFRILLFVFMLIVVVISVTLAGLPYIADQFLGTESAITTLFVCVMGPLMPAMPAWRHAARRMGKKYCLMAALTLFTTGALGVVALRAVTEAIRLEICAPYSSLPEPASPSRNSCHK